MKKRTLYTIIYSFFASLRKAYLRRIYGATITGYIENAEGWKHIGEEKTITIPSTHDLYYAISFVIEEHLQKLTKNVERSISTIGYKITNKRQEKQNGHIFHHITYQVCGK